MGPVVNISTENTTTTLAQFEKLTSGKFFFNRFGFDHSSISTVHVYHSLLIYIAHRKMSCLPGLIFTCFSFLDSQLTN